MQTTCCFIGHREIREPEALGKKLYLLIENIIVNEGVDTFLFGSKSGFNSLCHKTVSELKEKYPHIKRVYVRAEYPVINDDYKDYILRNYEETFYPEKIGGSGKAVYLRRNREMIDKCRCCVVYFDEAVRYGNRKSGTKAALDYATGLGKTVFNAYLLL